MISSAKLHHNNSGWKMFQNVTFFLMASSEVLVLFSIFPEIFTEQVFRQVHCKAIVVLFLGNNKKQEFHFDGNFLFRLALAGLSAGPNLGAEPVALTADC